MMSEFSAKPEDRVPPVVVAPSPASASRWQRPIVAGLSLPWLAGAAVALLATAWILFAPDSSPTVNQLAFREDPIEQPLMTSEGHETVPAVSMPKEGSQFQDEVAGMIGGVRAYAETNRSAISRLSETVKSQGAGMSLQQQQLIEAQAQISVLSARLSAVEGRTDTQVSKQRVNKSAARSSSPLAGMRLQAVQSGMAWVYWQDRTWAVTVGERLGQLTVTGIDAAARKVHTSAGTLQ